MFLVFATCALSQQAQQPIKSHALGDNQQQAKDKKEECENKKADPSKPMPMLPIDNRRPGDGIKDKAQRATQDAYDSPRTWRHIFKDPTSVFTGGLALFTIGLVLIGIRQVWVSRDIGKRQLRAYISPDKFVLKNAIGPIAPSLVAVFKNSGQTPAFHMTCCSDIGWGRFPPSINFSLAEDVLGGSRGTIGPGACFTQDYPLGKPFSEDDKRGLESEKAAIYFYGYVSYRDIFDEPHKTRFRVYYTGGLGSGKPILLSACSEGNEAD